MSSILCAPQVVHPAGEVIKPDSWRCVNDEGMPVHGRPYEKGNLYIHFTVKFPDELDAGTMDALRKLLPPGAASASLNGRMETEDIEQARASGCLQCVHARRCSASEVCTGFPEDDHGCASQAAAAQRRVCLAQRSKEVEDAEQAPGRLGCMCVCSSFSTKQQSMRCARQP